MTRMFDKKSGAVVLSAEEVARLIIDLGMNLPITPDEIAKSVGASSFAALTNENKIFTKQTLLPIIRIAHKYKLLKLIPAHGIPSFSFDLSEVKINLEGEPLGLDKSIPEYELAGLPGRLAGFDIDFPLCLPASILSSNSSWLKFYAKRGFSILTYKTVRSRVTSAHTWPNWMFLRDARAQSGASLGVATGEVGYLPVNFAGASMANSFGVPSLGPEWWVKDVKRARRGLRPGQVLIVSVVASESSSDDSIVQDFVETAKLAKGAGANIVELNYSCPNTQSEGKTGQVFQDPELSRRISMAVKTAVKSTPVFVKIGYLKSDKLQTFVEANRGFIDGITAINTIPAEIRTGQGAPAFPGDGRLVAGVSGSAIRDAAHQVAMDLVTLRQKLCTEGQKRFAIVSLGGIITKKDFEKRLATGVDAVGICTGAYLNANIGVEIRYDNTRASSYPQAEVIRETQPGFTIKPEASRESDLSEGGNPRTRATPVKREGTRSRSRLATENPMAERSPKREDIRKQKSKSTDLRKFIEYADATIKTPADVKAILDRHDKEYQEAWSQYEKRVSKRK